MSKFSWKSLVRKGVLVPSRRLRVAVDAVREQRLLSAQIEGVRFLMGLLSIDSSAFTGAKVLLNAGRTIRGCTEIELFIAHLLARGGARAFFIYDDGLLPHWDSTRISHGSALTPYSSGKRQRVSHEGYWSAMFRAFSHSGLTCCPYSSLVGKHVGDVDLDECDQADAIASTIRYFEDVTVDLDASDDLEVPDR